MLLSTALFDRKLWPDVTKNCRQRELLPVVRMCGIYVYISIYILKPSYREWNVCVCMYASILLVLAMVRIHITSLCNGRDTFIMMYIQG